LPFSQASENNKRYILEILRRHLAGTLRVLEIGSGTGQHAVYFAEAMPELTWQASDTSEMIATLAPRINTARLSNLPNPVEIDVNQANWCVAPVEAIFTANTLHIIDSASVENFFHGAGRCLDRNGLLLVYGPFKYKGEFTTASNASFDIWLKARDPESGVRDFEWVEGLARSQGMVLVEDNAMPANNQLLVWRKQ
jgi:cyclopropane fatty-acyl-phospholipid synthase-like methyltransferase